jgi:hypothetical protein
MANLAGTDQSVAQQRPEYFLTEKESLQLKFEGEKFNLK